MSFWFVRCLSLLHTGVCRSKVICFEVNSDASVTTLMLLLCFVVFHNSGVRGKHKTCASKAPGHVPSQRLVRLHLFREWRIFQGTGEGSWLVVQARSRCFFRCSMKTMQILAYLHNFLSSFSSPQSLIKTVVSNVTCFQWRVFGGVDLPRIVRPCWNTRSRKGLENGWTGAYMDLSIGDPLLATPKWPAKSCEIHKNSAMYFVRGTRSVSIALTEVSWNHFIRFSATFSKDAGQNSSFGWLQKGMNCLVIIQDDLIVTGMMFSTRSLMRGYLRSCRPEYM